MIELQLIDTNCNDCIFMERDFETKKKWEIFHRELQLKEFNTRKEKGFIRPKAQFQFDKSKLIQYGICSKLKKQVSFIPNQCNPQNQDCFKHRRL